MRENQQDHADKINRIDLRTRDDLWSPAVRWNTGRRQCICSRTKIDSMYSYVVKIALHRNFLRITFNFASQNFYFASQTALRYRMNSSLLYITTSWRRSAPTKDQVRILFLPIVLLKMRYENVRLQMRLFPFLKISAVTYTTACARFVFERHQRTIFSLRSCTACACMLSLCMLARSRGAARDGSCSRTRSQRRKVDKCRVADKKQTDKQTNTHYSFIGIDIYIYIYTRRTMKDQNSLILNLLPDDGV